MQDEDGAWSIFGNNYRGDVERVQRGSYSNGWYNNRYAYDAFGNYSEETDSPKKNPFRYSGEYTDDETGLIYLRNRYYDPAIGRFITEDPVKDRLNWYAYCGNNPVNYVDSLGLEDVYIFYGLKHGDNGGFDSRAKKEAKSWRKQNMTVKLIPVKSEEQFVEEWNNMDNNGSNIVKVSLYFHSTPDTLIINSTEREYMTVEENGVTLKGSDGTSILKLNRKTISTICLYAYMLAILHIKVMLIIWRWFFLKARM